MPTFIYKCKTCGEVFTKDYTWKEVKEDKQQAEKQVCPKCGSKEIQRIYTSPELRFIGSGFYVNDYKKKGG